MLYLGEYDSGQYFSSVDQQHVVNNEGGIRTDVYVDSKGHYTVGGGIDLTQQTAQSLSNMGVSDSVINQLQSVIGVNPGVGAPAPGINLSQANAQSMTTSVMTSYFNNTGQQYNSASSVGNFSNLPTEAQTAIADLAYNMGNLANAAPNFWSQVTSGNWQAAINNLTGTNGQPPFSNSPGLNNRAAGDGQLLQRALNAGTLPTHH